MTAVPAPFPGAPESGPAVPSTTDSPGALPAPPAAAVLSARPPTAEQRSEILSPATLGRTVDRIAHQILERHGEDDIVLLGIPTRGVHLARRLADRLTTFAGPTAGRLSVGSLDITLYRDDLRRHPPRALEETSLPDEGIDNAIVVLVDDVLYSGRTVRAALDALRDHGRPRIVQLAVLVDRGHRQLPIRADYVGKNIPTAFTDDVAVRMVETDGVDSVDLVRVVPAGIDPAGPEPASAEPAEIDPARSDRPRPSRPGTLPSDGKQEL